MKVTPQKFTSALRYGLPSLRIVNSSSEASSLPVRRSSTEVRVEKSVPAYESPPTKTVQAASLPPGETRARVGMPVSACAETSFRRASRTTAR